MKETWWDTLGKGLDSKARGGAWDRGFCPTYLTRPPSWFLFSISSLYGLKDQRSGEVNRATQAGLTSALLSHSRLFCLVVKTGGEDAGTLYSRVMNWSYRYHFQDV